MKTLLACATLVIASTSSAFAADGRVADATLAKMGLGGMQVMSDAQGMEVRGMAIAKVSGWSSAGNHTAETYNEYFALGHRSASGSSYSGVSTYSHHHLSVTKAFGGASARAH